MSGSTITSSRCSECSRAIVPPRDTCPYCGKNAGPMIRLELPAQGVVQSYTTLQMPPEGFKAPLPMALVELKHGALILCLASDDSESSVYIGNRVEIVVDSEDRFRYRVIA